MKNERELSGQVYEAKEDMEAADRLIGAYLPFIRSETAKFLGRPPQEGHDDELSIAMIAFHEAIQGYSRGRGAFLPYAAMLIKSRLIDYQRKEKRHKGILSLETPAGEDENALGDTLPGDGDHGEDIVMRDATRAEIEELSAQMKLFGVSLTDVADNCPRQQRTLAACRKAMQYAADHPSLLDDFVRTRRLPLSALCEGSRVERKTLERHRKYMVALLLICTNGYELIRGHLKQVLKGGTAK